MEDLTWSSNPNIIDRIMAAKLTTEQHKQHFIAVLSSRSLRTFAQLFQCGVFDFACDTEFSRSGREKTNFGRVQERCNVTFEPTEPTLTATKLFMPAQSQRFMDLRRRQHVACRSTFSRGIPGTSTSARCLDKRRPTKMWCSSVTNSATKQPSRQSPAAGVTCRDRNRCVSIAKPSAQRTPSGPV